MTRYPFFRLVALGWLVGTPLLMAQEEVTPAKPAVVDPAPAPPSDGAPSAVIEEVVPGRRAALGDVLREGPIHEALANDVSPPRLVPPPAGKIPPKDILEVKPRIEADIAAQAVWLRGYWLWDQDREDFIWVSGVWRFPPPNHRWIAGSWAQTSEGWRRMEGYWVRRGTTGLQLLAQRPETAPAETAPPADPNWVWNPSYYLWSPAGWALVPGYWDYPLAARGQAFAAIDFQNDDYAQPDFQLQTAYAIPFDAITRNDQDGFVYQLSEETDLEQSIELLLTAPAAGLRLPGDAQAEVVVTPPPAPITKGVISGVVRRGDYAPPGLEVRLEGARTLTATTDDRGRFTFRDVPYGEYVIFAGGPVQNITRRGMGTVQLATPTAEVEISLR